MVPKPNPQDSAEFIQKLTDYHSKRGSLFDPYPRVSTKPIDHLHLFNTIVAYGGYDRVSDEKLAWRKIAQEFDLPAQNAPAVAFSLKTVYYKYLAAYEIRTIHNKEPPPKEILEDQTAKGGGLLTRTLENYTRKPTRDEQSEASGDEGTPSREQNMNEETPGSGGRITRGLRQAPPQRILFQPDTGPARTTNRHISNTPHAASPQQSTHQHHQPQPRGASTSYNPSSNADNTSSTVTNYEPRLSQPMTLRPVITPGNNPAEFVRRQQAHENQLAGRPIISRPSGISYPGSHFDGPNIYVRCLCALRSGIQSEQDYALHHLVKISMERGDKYRFEGFPGLAEALIEKVLEVASLFYKVEWQVVYTEDGISDPNILNGVYGTPDILKRIERFPPIEVDDNVYTADFSNTMLMVNEAALTLRNMVLSLPENAVYVSEIAPLRDLLSIVLNLPKSESVVELKHYALDIAENLTQYLHLDETDPLYISLLAYLESNDRGAILTSLRAINRISMELEENNLLRGIPAKVIQNIIDWTFVNDEELTYACLDFLYQYTAVVENVDFLLAHVQVEGLVNQLVRLLGYGARIHDIPLYPPGREIRVAAPQRIALLPEELVPELLKLEEPDRSSQWLRCLFEEDPEESITQIALWQAYQACFTEKATAAGLKVLAAAEFIKNVSTTFGEKVTAQVEPGAVPKFIIKGIRMRSIAAGLHGEEIYECAWKTNHNASELCRRVFMSPAKVYEHILKYHLAAREKEDGRLENTSGRQYICLWTGCHRFHAAPATTLLDIANHLNIHLRPRPTTNNSGTQPPVKRVKGSYNMNKPKRTFSWYYTATDERQNPAGLPLSAALVLRNLARNFPKTEAEETALRGGGVSYNEQFFKPIEPRLFEIMTHTKVLTENMMDLLSALRDT